MPQTTTNFDRNRWLECVSVNFLASTPPFSAVVAGWSAAYGNVITNAIPNGDGADVFITGPQAIQPTPLDAQGNLLVDAQGNLILSNGICSRDSPIAVAYDTSQGTPMLGQVWHAQAGSYILGLNNLIYDTGIMAYGVLAPGLLLGYRHPHLQGKVSLTSTGPTTIAANTTATFSWQVQNSINAWNQFDPAHPQAILSTYPLQAIQPNAIITDIVFATVQMTPAATTNPSGNIYLYFKNGASPFSAFAFGLAGRGFPYMLPDGSASGITSPLSLNVWSDVLSGEAPGFTLALENDSNVAFTSVSATVVYGVVPG